MKISKQNITLVIALLSFGLNIFLLTDKYTGDKKIAYVRSTELVYGYLGMKEAHNKFEEKTKRIQSNIDTLQKDYQLAFSRYSTEAPHLSKEEKAEREQVLMKQQESLVNYAQNVEGKMKEEEQNNTQSVLNQINSFVEEYGKEKGDEVILGTTLSGNLLYGDEAIDITKEVLEKLNKNYKGES